jgi:transcriptional regulator with XRE-family HTH domain
MSVIEDILNSEVMDDYLEHIGMPRRSGRYPWGSGDDPYQRNRDFLSRVEELKKSGWKETPENIMEEFGLTTGEYRSEVSLATNERRALNQARARSLKDDGLSATEIGRQMGVNESTVRSWLNEDAQRRANKAQETANFLKEQVDSRGMIDVGAGVNRELNISQEKMRDALRILEKEGYVVYSGGIPQATNPGQQTTQKVLCPPGTQHKDIYNYDQVHSLKEYISRDGGDTYEKKFHYPESMDSKRLKIRYNEEGGIDKDGIVELRRGVEDLSLGESRYSQVRILVDGTHYIKGMAVYSDDMPDGVDVVFNTNKKQGTPMKDVLKEIKEDPDNPFGSTIKDAEQGGQYWYTDKKGNRKLGLINKRSDEGDWEDWQDALPSQFLGKQSLSMAKKQLNLAKADKLAEFDDICSLTNPTIKKHLLEEFADNCDSAAVNLKAAALPGQKHHVIIPINTLKDTEVYAPKYENGTKLALIRYPHGGTFEIPILTVNNKNALARKIIPGDVADAVGINSKVAERLSGADFDGDTVMAIPTHDAGGKVKITSTPPLEGLKDFDPKTKYGSDSKSVDSDGVTHYYRNGKEYRLMSKKETQMQMGVISNLITDMTLAGASDSEKAAAVRHSMVVIDAHKHKLDYKQSEIDNNIAALHKAYQGKATGGASTILSRAKSPERVAKRQGSPHVNMEGDDLFDPSKPEGSKVYKTADDAYYPDRDYDKATKTVTLRTASGKKITYNADDARAREEYDPVKNVNKDTGEVTFTNKSGTITYKRRTRTQESTKMAEHDDAYDLVSTAKHPMELVYAEYANSMKSLANKARMEMVHTGKIAYSSSAAKVYDPEVKELKRKLNEAKLNAPKEREAQRRTNAEVQAKLDAGLIDKSDVKKVSQRTLNKYREEVGSVSRRKRNIDITDREWEAIQAGAVSENILIDILANTDAAKLRQRATPRTSTTLSSAKIAKIKAYRASNYTLNEIAKKLGVSVSTVSNYLNGGK